MREIQELGKKQKTNSRVSSQVKIKTEGSSLKRKLESSFAAVAGENTSVKKIIKNAL